AIKAKDYNSAIEFCQKKIQMYKRDKEAWINLANTYFLVGEIQKGESIFEKYLKDKPKYATLWKELGKNYFHVKEFDKAIESFNHYTKLNPYDFEPFKLMAEMHYDTGDFQNALENIDKAIKLRSTNKNLIELREQILSKMDNKKG
ncbi:MAG: tetratricopeptide repeat protein, partial [Promethearchaeota archaeon]